MENTIFWDVTQWNLIEICKFWVKECVQQACSTQKAVSSVLSLYEPIKSHNPFQLCVLKYDISTSISDN
jgi:hypothetical protein